MAKEPSPEISALEPTDQPVTPTSTKTAPTPEASSPVQQADSPDKPAADRAPGTPNRLINEKSPYLLQHAYNPVDWYPWGEEAFEKARRENKPIFLSIGYSTCHWCHVMENESFEDPDVARLMNQTFVSIKVDREERPDIDSLYTDAAVLINNSAGWPLNVIITPDQKPFFAATYIPKETRFNRTGMMELIPQVQEIWTTKNDEVLEIANRVTAALEQGAEGLPPGQLTPSEAVLEAGYEELAPNFDPQYGGFGTAPKFPTPSNLLFLLRYWDRTGDEQALTMVETTLRAMRQGGLYDQIGFGFHRYSTDQTWLVPHFEKMLYDQALLAMVYTEAYQATGNREYEQTAREIFTYVLRDMTASNGGFYSAEDADSEGEEGKFYLWTEDELREVLSSEDADLFIAAFNVDQAGNFAEPEQDQPEGLNILHQSKPLSQLAADLQISEEEMVATLESIRQQLFAIREARIHPHKDDKILTDWNGLMIAALAKGAQTFNEPEYTLAAQKAADFVLTEMQDENGRLLHRHRDGETTISATVNDYAFFTWGLLELYETDFDVNHLASAIRLTEEALTHFWDDQAGGFYFTPDDGEALLVRKKEIYDGVTPSGNSVAMLNLLRLGRITADTHFEEHAAKIGDAFAENVKRAPSAYLQLMSGMDFGIGPSFEIVIVGHPEAEDTQAMLAALRGQFAPNKVVLLRPPEEASEITRLADYTKYYAYLNDQATVYVCQNYYCELPTNDIEKMLELLGKT